MFKTRYLKTLPVNSKLISDMKNTNHCFHVPTIFYFYDLIQVPEISEIMANLFGGGGSGGTSADKAKKKQKPHVTRRS